jgi:hypothetical protein
MPADKPKVGSDEWYRDTLYADLMARNKATAIYDRYYRGEHRLAFATNKFREAFGALFSAFADNWCDLVVDAVEERIDVEGFRFADETDADADAWKIWQRNQMDALSQQGHLESLIYGTASVLVWNDTAGDQAEITMEHPTQMIVRTDPARVTRRIAALKVWAGDDKTNMATLYTPKRVVKWTAKGSRSGAKPAWTTRGETIEHDLGVVPVVQLPNRPRLLRPGRSEIAGVIPVQDAVNKLIADMMVASEFQAFRQRWATGLEIPTIFDDNGDPLPADEALKKTWKHAVDRLLWTTAPDTKFGEFTATDLAPFVTAVEMLVQHVASQTRTPPHYFYLSGQFPSGESIKSAETGLVAKVLRKERFYGEAWEEVMRLAFAVEGDDRKAADYSAEVIWADPESRTESEHVDAVTKKAALGVPLQQIYEDLGYSATTIARFEQMRAREQAQTLTLATALSSALDDAGPAPAGQPPANPEV